MKDNVEKLRRAIGIDFDHSHGPAEEINLNQPPLPNNYQSQQQNQKEPEQPQVPKPFAIDGQKPPISIQREPIKIEPKSSQPHQTPIQGDNTLFVKIDKHQDVAVEISRTKIEMKNMVDTISILNQAEKLKAEAIAKFEQNIRQFDSRLEAIETNLGFRITDDKEKEDENAPNVAGKNIKDLNLLHSEIKNLKDELSTIERP